jgi:hypothetical protein
MLAESDELHAQLSRRRSNAQQSARDSSLVSAVSDALKAVADGIGVSRDDAAAVAGELLREAPTSS